jgi:hypothetical protein
LIILIMFGEEYKLRKVYYFLYLVPYII